MSNREFTATRTMLANAMATAGADLLEYMGTAAALAAIPDTEPPKYVVAGTLAMIGKLLPAGPVPPLTAPAPLTDELPAILFDGPAVYAEIVAKRGTSIPEVVADTLDAVVRLMRAERKSAAPAPQQSESIDTPEYHRVREEFELATKLGARFDINSAMLNVDALLRAKAAPAPQQSDLTDELRERVRDAVAQALDGIYYCGRVWSAWQVNTMREDDFTPAAEVDDVLDGIVDAALSEVAKAAPVAPVQTAEPQKIEAWCERDGDEWVIYAAESSTGQYIAKHMKERHGVDVFALPPQVAAPVQAEQAQAEPVAWMHEDGRVVTASTMAGARRDGGAMLSSLRGYTIPLYAAPALPAQAEQAQAPEAFAVGQKCSGQNFKDPKNAYLNGMECEILEAEQGQLCQKSAMEGPGVKVVNGYVVRWANGEKDVVARDFLRAPSTATSNDTDRD